MSGFRSPILSVTVLNWVGLISSASVAVRIVHGFPSGWLHRQFNFKLDSFMRRRSVLRGEGDGKKSCSLGNRLQNTKAICIQIFVLFHFHSAGTSTVHSNFCNALCPIYSKETSILHVCIILLSVTMFICH
jgi:hypothetical protein